MKSMKNMKGLDVVKILSRKKAQNLLRQGYEGQEGAKIGEASFIDTVLNATCHGSVIVELKAVKTLTDIESAQVLQELLENIINVYLS